jgi:O-antigen/teichoic acid export membrane protein
MVSLITNLKKTILKGLEGSLLRAAVGSFGFRIANLLLSFVVSILLTRILGVDGYGIYAFSMSWVLILNIIGSLGSRGLVVREVATNNSHQRWGVIRGFLQWSNTVVILASIAVSVVFAIGMWQFSATDNTDTFQTLLLSLVLVPVMSLTIIRQSAMQGFGHILKGQLPDSILQPLLFITFLVCTYWLNSGEVEVIWVMGLKVISSILAFAIGAYLLYRIIPPQIKKASPEYQTSQWLPSMLSLVFIAGTGVIYTRSDVVMLGMMVGPSAVGLYAIATRLANLVLISQQVGANVLGPHVASLYANQEIKRLQALTRKSTRAVVAYALPLTLGMIVFSPWLLSIFGPDFLESRNILIVLCVSKLLNVSTGPVNLLLTMTHYERVNAVVTGVGAILNLILNFLLIPIYGPMGAALATGFTSIIANVILAIIVYRRLGINSTILSY